MKGPSKGAAVPYTSPCAFNRVRYGCRGNRLSRDEWFSTLYQLTVDELVLVTWSGPEKAPARM